MVLPFYSESSSLTTLYQSAVDAFPATKKRQYATNTVKIVRLEWTPYLGMKTLYLKALAQNFTGEGKEYQPMMLFKNVHYYQENTHNADLLNIKVHDKIYHLKPLSKEKQQVLLRCQCGDFFWRFHHYDHLDKSLYGRNRKKYEAISNRRGPANPQELPGMCKHLMSMMYMLQDSKIIKD